MSETVFTVRYICILWYYVAALTLFHQGTMNWRELPLLVLSWLCILHLPFCDARIPSPSSLGSSVSILFQNNLNFTDDANHIGILLLDPMNQNAAAAACHALNESLLPRQSIASHASDVVPQLRYLSYAGKVPSNQRFWIADGVVSAASGEALTVTTAPSSSVFPVLCSQSARGTIDTNSAASSPNMISTSPSLHPQKNTFVGFRNLKSFRFLGIPYSNTVQRFKHSTVNSATSTSFDATNFGPECFQTGTGNMNEQCLFLNIYTPFLPSASTKTSDLKPVLVSIHGGAFTNGAGSDPTMDGGNLASRGDIVQVTINYRLSSVGFLALPNSSLTGNYGLGDQVTALEWVQQNIHVFGGDPSRVAIWGQSAGAASVRALMASPKSIGKFSAAIPTSNLAGFDYATTYSQYLTIDQEAVVAANDIVELTNCTSDDVTTVVDCLTNVDASTLVNLATVARYVVVDHNLILSDGLQVTGKGPIAKVPVLLGTTADDGAAFIGFPSEGQSLESAIEAILPENLTQAVIASGLFPMPNTGNTTLDIFNVTARIATDVIFRCLDQATVFSAVKHNIWDNVWYYQFDRSWQTPGFDPNFPVCDAPITPQFPNGDPNLPYFKCHSGDLYFEFGSLAQFGFPFRDANDWAITKIVMDYWTSFVRTHDPNPDIGFLEARGYESTIEVVKETGHWDSVTKTRNTLRRLNVTPRQDGFLEVQQCEVLTLPLSFYETSL
jgi:carboxylesterase type B